MPSISIRNNQVPRNVILVNNSSSIPSNYNDVSELHGKYPKGTANICTNPGSTGGNATHQHAADCHSHSGPLGHTHTFPSAPVSTGFSIKAPIPFNAGCSSLISGYHGHDFPLQSAGCSSTDSSPHQHNSNSNEPSYTTFGFIKRNTIGMRSKSLPANAALIWANSLASIPNKFVKNVVNAGTIFKSRDACANPGSTGGSDTHQHTSDGTHGHTVSVASHGHTFNSSPSAQTNPSGNNAYRTQFGSQPGYASYSSWPHGGNTMAVASVSQPGSSTPNGGHQHDSLSLLPPYREVVQIKTNSVGMKLDPIPKNSIVAWSGVNACIPVGFQLADGTCGTSDLRGKYLRQITTACTDPGTTGGSATHQHSSSPHTHTFSGLAHTHAGAGGSSDIGPSSQNQIAGTSPANPGVTYLGYNHGHGAPPAISTTASPCSATSPNESHTHDSIDHNPPFYTVAWIQKL